MAVIPLPNIGIVGAGTMGSGIALLALRAGSEVYIQDSYPQMLDKAAEYVRSYLEQKDEGYRFKSLHLVNRMEDLASTKIVIEAAPEHLDLKKEIFRQLDAICQPSAILATNTSTLSVTAIASATQYPERVAGMHFFNPAPVLPLVEVVKAARTGQETVAGLVDLAQAFGKTPVVTGDTPGFIVNRVARPFYGEALRLLGESVATHEQIDQIVEGAGFKMGPFRLMDLIGIDINAGAMRSMYEQTFGEPRYRPHWIQMQKLAEGALGRKTGRGFYEYKDVGSGQRDEEKTVTEAQKNPLSGVGGGFLMSHGSWAPGLEELCRRQETTIIASVPPKLNFAAGFVILGHNEGAQPIISAFDQDLPEEIPLFVQCADITLSEAARWVKHLERLIGFDGLFLDGSVVTLQDSGRLALEIRAKAEAIVRTLGKEAIWVRESVPLVLPRIICQLVNEAAFAESEAVADGVTIDLAMRLGVNYPRGPLEWGKAIGYEKVLAVLDHLYAEYHEERYRVCVHLRRWAREGRRG